MSATSTPTRTLPGIARTAWSRTTYEIRSYFREMDTVIFAFLYPIIMLFIFGSVFTGDVGQGASFKQYFLPGMIATGFMLSSFQTLAIAVATDRDDNTLKRLHGTPMPLVSYFLGKIGQVLITSIAQVAALLAVARFVFDIPLPTDPALWVRFAWIFALSVATGVVLGIAFSTVPRSAKSASSVVIPVVLVLQFISGVFFVFADLPTWMQRTAEVFPLKWIAQALRSVFLPDSYAQAEPSGSWQLGTGALVLAAWLVGGLIVGIRTFRWTRRDDN